MKHKHDNKLMTILAIIGLYFLISFLAGCSKEINLGGNNAAVLSFKYSYEWKLLKIDTLWSERNINPVEFQKVLAAKQIDTLGKYSCPAIGTVLINGVYVPFQFEVIKYIYN